MLSTAVLITLSLCISGFIPCFTHSSQNISGSKSTGRRGGGRTPCNFEQPLCRSYNSSPGAYTICSSNTSKMLRPHFTSISCTSEILVFPFYCWPAVTLKHRAPVTVRTGCDSGDITAACTYLLEQCGVCSCSVLAKFTIDHRDVLLLLLVRQSVSRH